MFSDNVVAVPPICDPSVPDDVIDPDTASDDVATFANVFAPEKYGMFPVTAADDVDSPVNESADPVSCIGNDVDSVPCLPFSVD